MRNEKMEKVLNEDTYMQVIAEIYYRGELIKTEFIKTNVYPEEIITIKYNGLKVEVV